MQIPAVFWFAELLLKLCPVFEWKGPTHRWLCSGQLLQKMPQMLMGAQGEAQWRSALKCKKIWLCPIAYAFGHKFCYNSTPRILNPQESHQYEVYLGALFPISNTGYKNTPHHTSLKKLNSYQEDKTNSVILSWCPLSCHSTFLAVEE